MTLSFQTVASGTRRATLLNGKECWFCVCASSDCSSKYYGPFATYEGALSECNVDCSNAHFTTPYLPDFVLIDDSPKHVNKLGVNLREFNKLIRGHNERAVKHKLYRPTNWEYVEGEDPHAIYDYVNPPEATLHL